MAAMHGGQSSGISGAQYAQGSAGVLEAAAIYQRGRMSRAVGRMRKKAGIAAGKQAVAASQRHALSMTKNAELLASRAIAVAAAGGGGADDPTVNNIVADIDAEGAYRAAIAMYEGETQANKLRYEGELAEWEGDMAYGASKVAAAGTLIQTGASMFKYG